MNHWFLPQYQNAIGKNDEKAQAELVVGEIADLINEKPLTVIQVIESTTNQVFIGKTYGELTKAVGILLKTNAKFTAAMVALVYLNNNMITHDGVMLAGQGDLSAMNQIIPMSPESGYHNLSAGGMDIVSAAVSAVGNIVGGSLNLAASKAQAKGQTESANLNLQAAQTQAEAQAIQSKEGTKQALLNTLGAKYSSGLDSKSLFIIIAIVVVGGGALWYMSRKPSAGIAPALTPPPATPPIAPTSTPMGPSAPVSASVKHEIGGGLSDIPPLKT